MTKNNLLETIRNNPNNALFFRSREVFGDKKYEVINENGKSYFRVIHKTGSAIYKLSGSNIGSFTSLK